MLFETERLILRELNHNDFLAMYAVLADSDIMQHYPYSFDEKRVRGWIAKNIERYRIFGFGLWAVVHKESGRVIGDCGLTMQNINGFIKPEIGYHINRHFQRQGYAKEAGSACISWAFLNTPFKELFSYMKESNTSSQATARSIGMKITESYIDDENETTCVYSISSDAWKINSI